MGNHYRIYYGFRLVNTLGGNISLLKKKTKQKTGSWNGLTITLFLGTNANK